MIMHSVFRYRRLRKAESRRWRMITPSLAPGLAALRRNRLAMFACCCWR
jgi:hypothetical protein